jgi:FtsP/CotA-like multicopper oxidase with cupredoxin domain
MKGKKSRIAALGALALLLLAVGTAWGITGTHNFPATPGVIDGVSGTLSIEGVRTFNLQALSGHISVPEGNSVFIWGFSESTETDVQYPSPTLIVNQGETVTVNLANTLPVPVSIVFPGQSDVTSIGDSTGLLTAEADPLIGVASYSFVASNAGTYLYHSGTQTDLQVDMGLFGAIIVRPTGFDPMNPTAYGNSESAYNLEYLFLLSEIDPEIHRLVERGMMDAVDTTTFNPTYWFINGRCAPDTMFSPFAGWLPTQPYNCMPMMHVGDRMLMRVIGAGRSLHPYHHHGNHARVIARDGRLLDDPEALGSMIDLSYEVFTIQSVPGQTVDAIFTWTGEGMGWDIYGHTADDPPAPGEDPNDHLQPFPVLLPESGDLTYGGFWSGSPFMGVPGALPPGEGGLNPMSGFPYMWHSHTEKEMTNNGIFPGGLMTMMIVVSPGTPLMQATPPLTPGVNPIMGREGGQ